MTDKNKLPLNAHPASGGRFHVMAKPSGSTCNLDCKYCFYPFGQGASQLGKVLDELKRQGFDGTITCEYERPSPTLEKDVGECVKWYNTYLSHP